MAEMKKVVKVSVIFLFYVNAKIVSLTHKVGINVDFKELCRKESLNDK